MANRACCFVLSMHGSPWWPLLWFHSGMGITPLHCAYWSTHCPAHCLAHCNAHGSARCTVRYSADRHAHLLIAVLVALLFALLIAMSLGHCSAHCPVLCSADCATRCSSYWTARCSAMLMCCSLWCWLLCSVPARWPAHCYANRLLIAQLMHILAAHCLAHGSIHDIARLLLALLIYSWRCFIHGLVRGFCAWLHVPFTPSNP